MLDPKYKAFSRQNNVWLLAKFRIILLSNTACSEQGLRITVFDLKVVFLIFDKFMLGHAILTKLIGLVDKTFKITFFFSRKYFFLMILFGFG